MREGQRGLKYKIGVKTSAASRTVMKVLLSAGGWDCPLFWAGTDDGGCLRRCSLTLFSCKIESR